jgi:hypothetical protein
VRFVRFPRTPHLEGSQLAPGDEEMPMTTFASLVGQHLVVTEKLDGMNVGFGFDPDGKAALQTRMGLLDAKLIDPELSAYRAFVDDVAPALWPVLGTRYVVIGEWMFAKHVVFYDALPATFMCFDIYDREVGRYLSTSARTALLRGTPIASVPVLFDGEVARLEQLLWLVGDSRCKTPQWRDALEWEISHAGETDPERVRRETDDSQAMEGAIIKHEDDDFVVSRHKLVRRGLLVPVQNHSSWMARVRIPNRVL